MKPVGDAADLRRTSLRLGLQAGLLVIGCLFVVGALIFVVYERAEDASADQLLSDTTANIDAASEAPPGVLVVVVTAQGRSASPGMPEGLPDEEQIAATRADGKTRQVDIERGETATRCGRRPSTAGSRRRFSIVTRRTSNGAGSSPPS